MSRSIFEEETTLSPRARRIVAVLAIGTFSFCVALFSYAIYQQIILGEPWGNNPTSDSTLIILAIVTLLLSGAGSCFGWFVLANATCRVRVDARKITIDARPGGSRTLRLSEIDSLTTLPARGIKIGWSLGTGWTYNLGGSHLVRIVAKNGTKVSLGTARAEELQSALGQGSAPA